MMAKPCCVGRIDRLLNGMVDGEHADIVAAVDQRRYGGLLHHPERVARFLELCGVGDVEQLRQAGIFVSAQRGIHDVDREDPRLIGIETDATSIDRSDRACASAAVRWIRSADGSGIVLALGVVVDVGAGRTGAADGYISTISMPITSGREAVDRRPVCSGTPYALDDPHCPAGLLDAI